MDLDTRAARQMGIGSRRCLAVVAVALLAASQVVGAQKPSHDEQRARDSDICGYQLMTERERGQYRDRLRAATTDQELSQVRSEHRARMQARAKERGVTLSGSRGGGGSVQWALPAAVEGGRK